MRRICEVADIHPETLYQRIDFFYRQCKAFVAAHEKPLLEGMAIPRLYIAVEDKKTPAMRLGLVTGKVSLDDIIDFSTN